MKFQNQSVSLKEIPIGLIGASELEVDLNYQSPAKYIVKERHGYSVLAIRFDSTGQREERRFPASIKVYPQEVPNAN